MVDVLLNISVFISLVHFELIEFILPLKGSNSISFSLLTFLSQHFLVFLIFLLQKERPGPQLISLHLRKLIDFMFVLIPKFDKFRLMLKSNCSLDICHFSLQIMIFRNKVLILIGNRYFAVDQLVLPFDVLEHESSFVLKMEELTFGFVGVQNLTFKLFILVEEILDLSEVLVYVLIWLLLYHFRAVGFSIQPCAQGSDGLLSLPDNCFYIKIRIGWLIWLSSFVTFDEGAQSGYLLLSASDFLWALLDEYAVFDHLLLYLHISLGNVLDFSVGLVEEMAEPCHLLVEGYYFYFILVFQSGNFLFRACLCYFGLFQFILKVNILAFKNLHLFAFILKVISENIHLAFHFLKLSFNLQSEKFPLILRKTLCISPRFIDILLQFLQLSSSGFLIGLKSIVEINDLLL